MQEIGKYLIIAGIIILITGLAIYFLGGKTSWFGNLPGDIKIKKENFTFYAPIVSMLLISIGISFILWLISKIK